MKRIIIPVLLSVLSLAGVSAQAQPTRYLVKLKDKGNSPYSLSNPSAYLSQRSIDRRSRYGIAIDSTDLPVTPRYVQDLSKVANVTVLNVSRWLNEVSIQITDPNTIESTLAAINSLPFVKTSAPIAARTMSTAREIGKKLEETITPSPAREMDAQGSNYYSYGQSLPQVQIHHGEFLHNIGLRGQNMIIGVLDAGFTNYQTLAGFDSIRTNGQVLDTWDFVSNNTNVNEDHPHGTNVLSTMAANLPGRMVGTAPKAGYYLYRSEDAATEYPIEEHNWVCAAERVDSAGGNVITSSLGYNVFTDPAYNHTYADMNGYTTIAAKGANLAFHKGLVVLIAAGNSGNDGWKYLLTPADADSVVAVGAVNKDSVVAGFSSYGPSSDNQVKPDVASVGWGTILMDPWGNVGAGNGTSFATPNLAGLTTCLWQGFPELHNRRIVNALRLSGHKATAPDNRVGYGIPDMKKAVLLLLKDFATSSATLNSCRTTLTWTSKDMNAMRYEVERKAPGETSYTKLAEQVGTGATFANHTYSFTDTLRDVSRGTISYRIRQVIDTTSGSFAADYIDTVTVDNLTPCNSNGGNPNNSTLLVVPNPARQLFTLRVNTPAASNSLVIRIADATGQVVQQLTRAKGAGQAAYPIAIDKLSKGKYYVSVYDKDQLLGTTELLKL